MEKNKKLQYNSSNIENKNPTKHNNYEYNYVTVIYFCVFMYRSIHMVICLWTTT